MTEPAPIAPFDETSIPSGDAARFAESLLKLSRRNQASLTTSERNVIVVAANAYAAGVRGEPLTARKLMDGAADGIGAIARRIEAECVSSWLAQDPEYHEFLRLKERYG